MRRIEIKKGTQKIDGNKAEQLLLKMYEDNISGKINDMMYQTMSERKQNEINEYVKMRSKKFYSMGNK